MFRGAKTVRFLGLVFVVLACVWYVPVAGASFQEAPVPMIDDQVILPGESFDPVNLAGAIQDEDYPADQLTWTVTGSADLIVENAEGVVTITPPDASWVGSETLHFEACDPAGGCASDDAVFWVMDDADVPVSVTYIGNAGFMITAGDKKILIDALWKSLAEGDPRPADISDAQPPYDDIDLILITHDHADHFAPDIVCEYMKNNPDTAVVAPKTAVHALMAHGCRDAALIDLEAEHSTQMIVNDIGVKAMFLSHGMANYENLGYLVTTGGRRFFHTGDVEFTAAVYDLRNFGIWDTPLDVAFIAHFFLINESSSILRGVPPNYIVPMHYFFTDPEFDPAAVLAVYPDAVLFEEELESWTMPEN
jgi:L-ascorbate metabolism protein UlaG (beta-lactamase superfamily)